MSEHSWARIGQIGALLAGLAAFVTLIISLNLPTNLLIANIHPMVFQFPLSRNQIQNTVKVGPIADRLFGLTDARGLIKIILRNTGELQVTDISVKVSDAIFYATVDNRLATWSEKDVFSDQKELKLTAMRQGDSTTIYAWTKTPLELYQFWDKLGDQFQITFPQGVATKHIYIENNLIEGWLERNWTYIIFGSFFVIFILFLVAALILERRQKQS